STLALRQALAKNQKAWLRIGNSIFLTAIVQRSIVAGVAALLLHVSTHASAAATPAVFATDATEVTSTNPPAANAAAIVDGHVISMEEVTLECLRKYRGPIVDQMLQ